jgi:hypothetical protein
LKLLSYKIAVWEGALYRLLAGKRDSLVLTAGGGERKPYTDCWLGREVALY